MRKGMVSGLARPAYHDRNLFQVVLGYDPGAIAPHATTVRATTTIPAGRLGWVDAATIQVIRATAAAPASLARALISKVVSGSGTYAISARLFTNGVGDQHSQNVGACGVVRSGDILQIQTDDVSTGGTVNYWAHAHVSLFDA